MSSRKSVRFGIVVSRFNQQITRRLLEGALKALRGHRIPKKKIDVVWVPGAFELPVAALRMARSKRYQAVVALGCVLAGETLQFAYLSEAVFQGLMLAGVLSGVPVTCGVVTARQWKHAVARARPSGLNRGGEAAEAAWELVQSFRRRR